MLVSDENVVEQIMLKNEESMAFVLDRYGGLLNAVIRKYLHANQQDIEECLADVLVSIWFHIHSFDQERNEFKQWIAAIAKYRAIDYVRKTEREKKSVSSLKMNEGIGSGQQPGGFDADSILSRLSTEERAIFEKYYLEGVPTKEIANQFHAKESWVHNKLSRGRRKLKNILLNNEV
ncbi:sigma factor-like helix-turn-helix DNA-binding protein [Mesobacillus subterraneus]|uniref:RNA polymerase subunit sigma-70 n=1 Tax=Mesobacillus subterraneus TaxID=285983 RepID=A0A3R9DW40_9BACI|nr:sigma factor-like helix-turn-helix DNA-binding protein [Mesobacillus subterraneus]RSD28733.1 RNA polymerase subunit sigma-70 [Mesobacillus subterraneus]